MIATTLDRASRIAVLVSAAAAVAFQVWLGRRAWSPLPAIALASFALPLALSFVRMEAARWLVLGTAYLFTVPLILAYGRYDFFFSSVWLAALLGLIAGSWRRAGWTMPVPWRVPLALYALIVALTWPLIVARESDFSLSFLLGVRSLTSEGTPASVASLWIASAAASQMLGVLWVDAIYSTSAEPSRFARSVAWPLGGGALMALAVCLYQLGVDMSFLNSGLYASLHRASATMYDANAYAVVAALWIAGFAWLAAHTARVWVRAVLGVAALLSIAAVWGTGSRTGLLAAAFSIAGSFIVFGRNILGLSGRRIAAAVAAFVVLIGLTIAVASRSEAIGPIRRTANMFTGSPQKFLGRLWDREGYGATAHYFIERYPLTGTGVGTFHTLLTDYDRVAAGRDLPPDNAQNWLRHLLAELGVIGLLGLLVWGAVFLRSTLRRMKGPAAPRRALLAALAGAVVASSFGVPAQNPAVLITIWTFVCWYAIEKPEPTRPAWFASAPAWAVMWVTAAIAVYLTAAVAWNDLRVPYRALHAGYAYSAGVYASEEHEGAHFQWTEPRAVLVFPVRAGFLELTYWLHHDRLGEDPVRVRIWRKDRLIVDTSVGDQTPRTVYLRVLPGEPWMMLETEVSRPWLASLETRPRQLGVGLSRWRIVHTPPEGAHVIY